MMSLGGHHDYTGDVEYTRGLSSVHRDECGGYHECIEG